jgi:hypothetical protein
VVAATSPDELLERVQRSRDELAQLAIDLRLRITSVVEQIEARREAGDEVFPVVEFADLAAGTIAEAARQQIAATGCVVVRGTFSRDQALAWDAELAGYLDRNDFELRMLQKYPHHATGSGIWPVYWSLPQVQARQHPHMVTVRRFLNRFWHQGSRGPWFDPDHDIGYADRVRRRRPGAVSAGLATHNDAPSSAGWRVPENQVVFEPLLQGGLDAYDPWNAANRTTVDPASTVIASVFRTFQGWTALSHMQPGDGVLHVVPIPAAAGYRLVDGLACEAGAFGNQPVPAPRRDRGDELLARALVPIPPVEPGDTVWWHGDLFHSVADAATDVRWGNVMYIGAAPRCPRNDAYRPSLYPRFVAGVSPIDFPDDAFEADFVGRATPHDLNATGRAQFGVR